MGRVSRSICGESGLLAYNSGAVEPQLSRVGGGPDGPGSQVEGAPAEKSLRR
jgi:hypothetical protein